MVFRAERKLGLRALPGEPLCFGVPFDPPIGVLRDPPLDLQLTMSIPDFDE